MGNPPLYTVINNKRVLINRENREKVFAMKTRHVYSGSVIIVLLMMLFACAPVSSPPPQGASEDKAMQQATQQEMSATQPEDSPRMEEAAVEQQPGQLPVRYQQLAYMVQEKQEAKEVGLGDGEEIYIPVGADISTTTGPIPLRDILKRLAALKSMNISWASDVDQFASVDVDIRAEDDFFKAIDNILRQMDYFHEVQGNTIVVKYRETRKFHVAMPFMASKYNTGVGGDVLGSSGVGGSGAGSMKGNIQIVSEDNTFDIWDNIRTNLDQILEIWEETVPAPAETDTTTTTAAGGTDTEKKATITRRNVQAGKGYYTIDKPIGLITVTAPRPLIEKIETYLTNLQKEIYRQVTIEAKIIEVTLNDDSTKGIDWSDVISNVAVDFQFFGPSGLIYSPTDSARVVSQVSTPNNPFTAVLDALEEQGDTRVLANPKISVMNGQPALISTGENTRFIEEVSVTVNEGGTSTSVKTNSVMSGLGMAVVATILDNDEIILSLTPVTSDVKKIQTIAFGTDQLVVQLPTVNVREMNTLVRVKSGDMLVVGGLIDSTDTTDNVKVPILGDATDGIPFLERLFRHETKTKTKTELVIMLQPKIIL